MEKKPSTNNPIYSLDGKATSLLKIAEASNDDKTWRSFLERHTFTRKISASANLYLKEKLGEYLSAHEITTITGIKNPILSKWRGRGLLRATQLKGKWYYSVQSLLQVINSVDNENQKR
ncbi:hypothetical protein ACFLYE_01015 [Chloroflexota bacterium]